MYLPHVVHCLKYSHQLIQKITVTLFGNCGPETEFVSAETIRVWLCPL